VGFIRPRFDIADIVRLHRSALETRYSLNRQQRRVLTAMGQCRTAALGGHKEVCEQGDFEQISYNSCRDRHCPKCQALAQERWLAKETQRLLDLPHFHLVFTLPAELRFLAKQWPATFYGAFFRAVTQTLLKLFRTRLKATPGLMLVLHTWTRELGFHPHLHVLATAGGLALDGSGIVPSGRTYLFPVGMMGKSTLITYLWDQIMERLHLEMVNNPGFIPAVVFDGPASGEQKFSWRMLYVRILQALQSPLIDRKQAVTIQDGRFLTHGSSHGSTVAALRSAVESELIARRTFLLAIDEAVPLLRNRQGDSLETAMDTLKSLANICGLTLVLVGSYDLLKLTKLSGQLARRSSILDFPRFHKGIPEEVAIFKNVLFKLQVNLPLKKQPNLVKGAMRLMDESLGCVGILKDILCRALSLSLRAGGIWSDEHLKQSLLTRAAKKAILKEILIGENEMRNAAFGTGCYGQFPDIEKSLVDELKVAR
jgi:hypothetical protein